MIKAIIFDFGNVICNFHNYKFINKISKYTDKSTNEINEIIFNKSGLQSKYERGEITSDEFYIEVVNKCKLNISKNKFIESYTNIFTPIKPNFELVKKLKKKYKLGLLSNTSEWDYLYGIKTIEIFNLFDTITLSFEVKTSKPNKLIYEDALKKLNLKPSECVYIDDIKEFSDKATQIGMHGINYTPNTNLVEELKKISVDI